MDRNRQLTDDDLEKTASATRSKAKSSSATAKPRAWCKDVDDWLKSQP